MPLSPVTNFHGYVVWMEQRLVQEPQTHTIYGSMAMVPLRQLILAMVRFRRYDNGGRRPSKFVTLDGFLISLLPPIHFKDGLL